MSSLLLLSFSQKADAQYDNVIIERTSNIYGLPNGVIRDVIQDQYGYLWFGTREGIFRYDGYEFKAFRHDIMDVRTLSHPNVNQIIEEDNGDLWIATSDGLSHFDRRTSLFTRHYPIERATSERRVINDVSTLIKLPNKKLLCGIKDQLILFDTKTKISKPVNIFGPGEKSIFVREMLSIGDEVLLSTNFGFVMYSVEDSTAHIISSGALATIKTAISGMTKGRDGSIWFTTGMDVYQYRFDNDSLLKVDLPDDLKASRPRGVKLDKAGNIWINLYRNGLVKFNVETSESVHFRHIGSQENSLNSSDVTLSFEDSFGNIWVGTMTGISKIRLDDSGFRFIENINSDGSNSNNVFRAIQDSEGTLYTSTSDGFFSKKEFDIEGKKILELDGIPAVLGPNWLMEDSKGRIWVGASNVGIFRKSPSEDVFIKIDIDERLSKLGSYRILEDEFREDVYWFATSDGLCKYDEKAGATRWYKPREDLPSLKSNRFIFDQYNKDQFWFYYTYSKSIGYLDLKDEKFRVIEMAEADRKYLEGHIKDITIGKGGILWIASLYGLTKYDVHADNFEILGKKDGLMEKELQAVLLDKNENLWVSGHRFISMLDPVTGRFINYQDRKRMRNFQSKSKSIARNGNLMFGSVNGVFLFNPERLKKNMIPPMLVLTDFKVNNTTFLLPQSFEETQSIVLSSKQNNLSFDFSGLHYTDPSSIGYKCILEGYETDWREINGTHSVSYTNLNHSDYVLRVSASNLDGIWNEEGIKIPIKIRPAFWQTLWFKFLVAAILGLLALSFYQNKKRQFQLQKEIEIAEQSAAYKTKFLADVSHEIRTPMNAIIGLSKLTLDTKLDTKQNKFVSAIQESSQNLLAIINDLLDFTKLEAGKFKFISKDFELASVFKNLENTFGFGAKDKGLEFDISLSSDLPDKVNGDPIRLNQILTNLIGNAVKFTDQGRVWLKVAIEEETQESIVLKFEVGDTGIGIPNDKLESIFGNWVQIDSIAHKGVEGTGLGLAISRQLVERQEGKLKLESEVGKGSTVYFTIPFDKTRLQSAESKSKEGFTLKKGMKLLVVEDTYFNQMLILEFLKKHIEDPIITVKENGQLAIEEVEKDIYDMVLMDVKMPVMDGFEATKRIREMEDDARRSMPIIAVTASAVQDQLDKCREAGMDDYISKPIDEADLVRKIHLHTKS